MMKTWKIRMIYIGLFWFISVFQEQQASEHKHSKSPCSPPGRWCSVHSLCKADTVHRQVSLKCKGKDWYKSCAIMLIFITEVCNIGVDLKERQPKNFPIIFANSKKLKYPWLNALRLEQSIVRIAQEAEIYAYLIMLVFSFFFRDGIPQTRKAEETRVWQRKDGKWQNIHLHRSEPAPPNK